MKTKLMPVFFVAVLLISSYCVIADAHTIAVDAATGLSTQAAPHSAELNPAFIKYQQSLSTGKTLISGTNQTGTGYIPSPLNLTQLKGQAIRTPLVAASPTSLPVSYTHLTLPTNREV